MIKNLVKEVVTFSKKDKKTGEEKEMKITNFYLQLENGELVRIQPNSYEDDKGVKHSNMSVLSAIAIDKNNLPF